MISETFFPGTPEIPGARMDSNIRIDIDGGFERAVLGTCWGVLFRREYRGCAGCTQGETGRLAPRRPALVEAREKQG